MHAQSKSSAQTGGRAKWKIYQCSTSCRKALLPPPPLFRHTVPSSWPSSPSQPQYHALGLLINMLASEAWPAVISQCCCRLDLVAKEMELQTQSHRGGWCVTTGQSGRGNFPAEVSLNLIHSDLPISRASQASGFFFFHASPSFPRPRLTSLPILLVILSQPCS